MYMFSLRNNIYQIKIDMKIRGTTVYVYGITQFQEREWEIFLKNILTEEF